MINTMNFFITLIIATSFLVGKSSSEPVVSASHIRVTANLVTFGDDGQLPLVDGGGRCGGLGKTGLLRMAGCVGEGVCRIKIEEDEDDSVAHAAAVEFLPSRDMSSICLRIISLYGNEELVFDSGSIANSSVIKDQNYVLKADIYFKELVLDSYVTSSFIVYDGAEPSHEDFCVDAEFYIF